MINHHQHYLRRRFGRKHLDSVADVAASTADALAYLQDWINEAMPADKNGSSWGAISVAAIEAERAVRLCQQIRQACNAAPSDQTQFEPPALLQ